MLRIQPVLSVVRVSDLVSEVVCVLTGKTIETTPQH
jgi:hypothetical protein